MSRRSAAAEPQDEEEEKEGADGEDRGADGGRPLAHGERRARERDAVVLLEEAAAVLRERVQQPLAARDVDLDGGADEVDARAHVAAPALGERVVAGRRGERAGGRRGRR